MCHMVIECYKITNLLQADCRNSHIINIFCWKFFVSKQASPIHSRWRVFKMEKVSGKTHSSKQISNSKTTTTIFSFNQRINFLMPSMQYIYIYQLPSERNQLIFDLDRPFFFACHYLTLDIVFCLNWTTIRLNERPDSKEIVRHLKP